MHAIACKQYHVDDRTKKGKVVIEKGLKIARTLVKGPHYFFPLVDIRTWQLIDYYVPHFFDIWGIDDRFLLNCCLLWPQTKVLYR